MAPTIHCVRHAQGIMDISSAVKHDYYDDLAIIFSRNLTISDHSIMSGC